MPNQSKPSKESKQEPNRGDQSSRGQQSSRTEQSSQGKQATGSVQSSRDNPNRKGAAGEKEEGGNVSFRCADVGHPECPWQVSGRNAEELLPKIEQHGREKHGIKTFDNQTREKVRGAIRERAA
jgi:predicted small metal-binding protein